MGEGQKKREDGLDRLVVFLAKRDGIDKLVKTFQYVSKLAHWYLEARSPGLAARAKLWESTSGLSRKAFRTGRFLTGFNALRRTRLGPTPISLGLFANSGEMVYFFFDHLLWLARAGVLDPHLAPRFSFVSAFGEAFGYVFFIVLDLRSLRQGVLKEWALLREQPCDCDGKPQPSTAIANIRAQRVMLLMAISANLADLFIALADVAPNPFCNHTLTLGVSGLVSAWAGWYRNWPASM